MAESMELLKEVKNINKFLYMILEEQKKTNKYLDDFKRGTKQ